MHSWLRARRAPVAIPEPDWHAACIDIPWIGGLSTQQVSALRDHVGQFLRDKRFAPAAGLELVDGDCLRIAMLACLPIVELGYPWLRGWEEVIVYPGQFRVHREWQDEDSGVVNESHDWLAGESWLQGPLILSLDDIRQDLEHPYEGSNLVAHEIAHKLDMLDGSSDGVPPLPDVPRRQRWISVFQQAFDRFCGEVESGADTWLDPYAAQSPDEFFAVTTESYFSAPDLLAQALPAVHRELRALYGLELAIPANPEASR